MPEIADPDIDGTDTDLLPENGVTETLERMQAETPRRITANEDTWSNPRVDKKISRGRKSTTNSLKGLLGGGGIL